MDGGWSLVIVGVAQCSQSGTLTQRKQHVLHMYKCASEKLQLAVYIFHHFKQLLQVLYMAVP